jgi:CRP-like cAMP-binding protein
MPKPPSPAPDPNDLKSFVVSGAAGDFVFREGDAGAECFIIQDGQVELLKADRGQPQRLVVLGAGDFFGESGLFDDQFREISARALTDVQLLRIDRTTFERIVQEDPAIAVRMVRRLARYVRVQRTVEAAAAPPDVQVPVSPSVRVKAAKPSAVATTRAAANRVPRQAVLVVPSAEQEFTLADKDQWTVGRVDRAKGRRPDIDLTSFDPEQSLSRSHAMILRKSGRYYVREEPRVANGTFVDGERIQAGCEVELPDGAGVSFGLVDTVFAYRDG